MITISRVFTSLALCVTATGLVVSLAITGKVIVMLEPGIGEALDFANPVPVFSALAGGAKPFFNQFAGSPPVAAAPAPAVSAPKGKVRTAARPRKSQPRRTRS
jgi:hypothetical protein